MVKREEAQARTGKQHAAPMALYIIHRMLPLHLHSDRKIPTAKEPPGKTEFTAEAGTDPWTSRQVAWGGLEGHGMQHNCIALSARALGVGRIITTLRQVAVNVTCDTSAMCEGQQCSNSAAFKHSSPQHYNKMEVRGTENCNYAITRSGVQ